MRIALHDVHLQAPRSFYGLTGMGAIRRALPGYQIQHPTWVSGIPPGQVTPVSYPSIEHRLESMLQIWTQNTIAVRDGRAVKPTEEGANYMTPSIKAEMTRFAADYCHNNPFTCLGYDVPAIIDRLAAFYKTWYESAVTEYYDMKASGAYSDAQQDIPGQPPIDGYVAPVSAAPPQNTPAYVPQTYTPPPPVQQQAQPNIYPPAPQQQTYTPPPAQQQPQGPLPTVTVGVPAVLVHSPGPTAPAAPAPIYTAAPAPAPAPAPAATSNASAFNLDLGAGWLTEEMISGVPNWGLLVAVGLGAWFFLGRAR